ncbi:hypothetical protein MKW98_029060 [Papaver atlanticum]|uniref:Sulfotransferase n=1 Tax=Papaver atlanticum TaxID=357466 RepID=A0AAD4RZ64_9MAGN|nr:hypothetical protein MKW98_029060 [Papaver atlanticum]
MAASDANSGCNDGDFPKGSGRPGLGHDVQYQYQGFWCFAKGIENVMDFQQNFKGLGSDLVIASVPKSGKIWLKALAFAIANRVRYPCSTSSKSYHHHPLLTVSPHDLVPFVEFKHIIPDHSFLDPQRRLIATHVPYPSLPESCKTDNFISMWLFMNKLRASPALASDSNPSLSIEEAIRHVLGYWKESLEKPHKVLFLKYEDLKKEPSTQLKRLAEFMGCSFSLEEERQGVIEDISRLCSFEHMKNLDVNKNGTWRKRIDNKVYFRRGEIGDWKNYLTPQMVNRLDCLMEEKLQGSGLVF